MAVFKLMLNNFVLVVIGKYRKISTFRKNVALKNVITDRLPADNDNNVGKNIPEITEQQ